MNYEQKKVRDERKKNRERLLANEEFHKDSVIKNYDENIEKEKKIADLFEMNSIERDKVIEKIKTLMKQRSDYINHYHPKAFKV